MRARCRRGGRLSTGFINYASCMAFDELVAYFFMRSVDPREARNVGQSGTNKDSFRLRQLGNSLCKLCGGTRHAVSLLWVSDRIDSNHCGSAADLSENGCARISKICEATVLEKPVVWTFTHGAISNDGRQIEPISSVTDLHSRFRIDNRAKFVARCGPYGNRFC